MMVPLKKIVMMCCAVIFAAFLAACSDSPEEAFEKWRTAVLDEEEESASELVYMDPAGSGIGVKHYNALVIRNVKSLPNVKVRLESVEVDDVEDAGEDMVILTLTYRDSEKQDEGFMASLKGLFKSDNDKSTKLVMRNVEGQWKLDPYASMPLMNLFVKEETASADASAATGSAYGPAGDEKEQSAPNTELTGGNPNFEEASEGVQIDFANE